MTAIGHIGGAFTPSQISVTPLPVRNPQPAREIGNAEIERAISVALGAPTETEALLAFDQLMLSLGLGGSESEPTTPGVDRSSRQHLRDQVLASFRASKEATRRAIEITQQQLQLWDGLVRSPTAADAEADKQLVRDASAFVEPLQPASPQPVLAWPTSNSPGWFGVRPGQTVEKAARGGKYYRRTEDESGRRHYHYSAEAYLRRPGAHVDGPSAIQRHLHSRVRAILETGPAEPKHFDKLTSRFGHTAVARAVHAVGGRHVEGKVVLVHKKPTVRKGVETGTKPGTAPPGAGGAGGGSEGDPVGTVQIWGDRVMEKQPDGQWHVVGHVAGLEGESVPRSVIEKLREYLTENPASIRMMDSATRERIIFTLRATARTAEPTQKSKSRPVVCVDLDGTILQNAHDFPAFGAPMPGVHEAIAELRKHAQVWVFSARTNSREIKQQLDELGIIVDEVYSGPKPPEAKVFVDDRAVSFKSWPAALRETLRRLHVEPTQKSLADELRRPMESASAAPMSFDIHIEGKAGEVRYGRILPFDYGEIADTVGADGDPIDICVGPDPDSRLVLIVDQRVRTPRDDDESHGDKSDGTVFDEQKVLIGFSSYHDALAAWDTYYGEWAEPLVVSPLVFDDLLELVAAQRVTGGVLKSETA